MEKFCLGSPLPISMIDIASVVIDFYGKGSITTDQNSWENLPSSYYPKIESLHPIMRKLIRPCSRNKINGLLSQVRINKK